MTTKATFKDRFAELCGDRTQQAIAEALGVSRATVGYYINGDRSPDIEVLSRIAKYFDVTSDYLLGLSDNKNFENADIGKRIGLSDELIKQLEKVNNRANKSETVTEIAMLNAFLMLCCDVGILGNMCAYAKTLSLAAEKPQLSLHEIILLDEQTADNKEIVSLYHKAEALGLELLDQLEIIEIRELTISSAVNAIITRMFSEDRSKAVNAYLSLKERTFPNGNN